MSSIQIKHGVILNLVGLLFSLNPCHGLKGELIVGGDEANPGQFKYQVALRTESDKFLFCGGAIVSDLHIVTAAHCFVQEKQFVWEREGGVQVVAGVNDLNDADEAVIRRVDKVYVPKRYFETDIISDIAVIRLDEPLDLATNPNITALKAADPKHRYANQEAIVTGFGWSEVIKIPIPDSDDYMEDGSNNGRMRYAIAEVYTNEACRLAYEKGEGEKVPPGFICARIQQRDPQLPEGVCAGDSGSPLVHKNSTLIGVMSANQGGCTEAKLPSLYTRVQAHLSFLSSAMKDIDSMRIQTFTYPPRNSKAVPCKQE